MTAKAWVELTKLADEVADETVLSNILVKAEIFEYLLTCFDLFLRTRNQLGVF